MPRNDASSIYIRYNGSNESKTCNMQNTERLREQFSRIGWEDRFDAALQESCRNAALHGLADEAYSEWGDALEFCQILAEEQGVSPSDLEIGDLRQRWPEILFLENEWGIRVGRGRLFTLSDYGEVKQAIAELGEDEFARKYRERFGKQVPKGSHLL